MATSEDFYHSRQSYSLNENFNFDALDKLGYSKRRCDKRVLMFKIISECLPRINKVIDKKNDYNTVIAGSRGEGVCISCDSDADVLLIKKIVQCTEHLQVPLNPDKQVLFQLDFENVPCGYAKLRLVSVDNCISDFDFIAKLTENFVQHHDQKYLRNDKTLITISEHYRRGLIQQQSVFDDIAGPARTLKCHVPMLPEIHVFVDCVPAFRCTYPSVIDAWCKRERKHSWPNKDLIETVKRLDVLVVPAGCKGSMDEELQWRISLTLPEQALVHSFNDIQIKLYVALKMIAKHELKPKCDSITSYIVKNVIFWTFENNEINDVTKDKFDETLLQMLEQMKMCITWQYLPSYMIPSKNMLQYKIFEKEKVDLLRHINFIVRDGRNILFRCPLVKEMPFLSTAELEEMTAFKELLEQGVLAVFFVNATHLELTSGIWGNHGEPMNVVKTVLTKVFPIIRRYNPMGLFDRLNSISIETMVFCLVNGVMRGYHKS